jgi:hypothetical protein
MFFLVGLVVALLADVSSSAPSKLLLGGGIVVTVKDVGATCVLQVDVPAKRASPACRLRIRTQPLDDGSLLGNDDAPEFKFLWRFGSAVFDDAKHDLGKLPNTGDRDAMAPCPQAGTYYLGAKLLECGGADKSACSAVVSALVDNLGAVTIDVTQNMQTGHILTNFERGVDLYVTLDAAQGRSQLALDVETIGKSFFGLYTVKYREAKLLMFKDEAKADGLNRRYQIGPLPDETYVVRVAAMSPGDIVFSIKAAFGTSVDGVDYPTAVCARPACAAQAGCADCVVNGCKWCGAQCAAATSVSPACVDACAAGSAPSANGCAGAKSCNACAAVAGCMYCGGGNCFAGTPGSACPDDAPSLTACPADDATMTGAGERAGSAWIGAAAAAVVAAAQIGLTQQ